MFSLNKTVLTLCVVLEYLVESLLPICDVEPNTFWVKVENGLTLNGWIWGALNNAMLKWLRKSWGFSSMYVFVIRKCFTKHSQRLNPPGNGGHLSNNIYLSNLITSIYVTFKCFHIEIKLNSKCVLIKVYTFVLYTNLSVSYFCTKFR